MSVSFTKLGKLFVIIFSDNSSISCSLFSFWHPMMWMLVWPRTTNLQLLWRIICAMMHHTGQSLLHHGSGTFRVCPGVCHLWRLLGGVAFTWSEVVHWVCSFWGLLGGTDQGQPPHVLYRLGPQGTNYKAYTESCFLCWACRCQVTSSFEPRLAAASAGSGVT